MIEQVISVQGLKKTYVVGFFRKKVRALQDVSFSVQQGEIYGIVGPNGSGKTTSLKMITGLGRSDAGEIRIYGEPASSVEVRRRIGYLPENPYFYEHLNVRELVNFYGKMHGMVGKGLRLRTEELIELVGLSHATDRPLKRFSKGMRQRAGIAQALINDPDLVILDEPQTGLDPLGRREVRDLIFRLKGEGKTVVFSSHILPDVEAVCDRVAIFETGRVVAEGTLRELTAGAVKEFEIIASNVKAMPSQLHLVEERDGAKIMRVTGDVPIEPILKELIDGGAHISNVHYGRQSLEDILYSSLNNEVNEAEEEE